MDREFPSHASQHGPRAETNVAPAHRHAHTHGEASIPTNGDAHPNTRNTPPPERPAVCAVKTYHDRRVRKPRLLVSERGLIWQRRITRLSAASACLGRHRTRCLSAPATVRRCAGAHRERRQHQLIRQTAVATVEQPLPASADAAARRWCLWCAGHSMPAGAGHAGGVCRRQRVARVHGRPHLRAPGLRSAACRRIQQP